MVEQHLYLTGIFYSMNVDLCLKIFACKICQPIICSRICAIIALRSFIFEKNCLVKKQDTLGNLIMEITATTQCNVFLNQKKKFTIVFRCITKVYMLMVHDKINIFRMYEIRSMLRNLPIILFLVSSTFRIIFVQN